MMKRHLFRIAAVIFTVGISLHGFAYAMPSVCAFASETEISKGTLGASSATIHNGAHPSYVKSPTGGLSSDEVIEMLREEGIPIVTIGDVEVPLHGGNLDHHVWALLDMMFAVGGLALVVYMMIRKGKYEKFGLGDKRAVLGDDEETAARFRCMCGRRAIILCVLGVVMFLIVWEVNNQMVLINNWTILNAIVFTAEAAVVKLSFKKKEDYSSRASLLSRSA